MNGIDKIVERILDKAELDRRSILSKAEAEAKEILGGLKEMAEAEADNIIELGKEQARKILERSEGASVLESRNMLLAAKQELIDKAFLRAKGLLLQLPDEEYTSLLAKLAAPSLTAGNEEITLGQADLMHHESAVRRKINEIAAQKGLEPGVTISPAAGDFEGGLIIRQGNVETNCTFDAILRMLRDDMAGEIAGILFG
jgi:V/A-type H+-transporting ATPase subunit E